MPSAVLQKDLARFQVPPETPGKEKERCYFNPSCDQLIVSRRKAVWHHSSCQGVYAGYVWLHIASDWQHSPSPTAICCPSPKATDTV